MKIPEKLKTLAGLLFQDVKQENEAKRTAVIIRLFTLIMWVYYIVLLTLCMVQDGGLPLLFVSIPCMALYMGAFYGTYRNATTVSVYLVNGVTILWTLLTVGLLGWDCGVQHFLFVLMMLLFITSHVRTLWKALCALLLCSLRVLLLLYTTYHAPRYTLGKEMGLSFQILNTLTICVLLIVTMFLYSRDSAAMELKLVSYNEKLQKMAATDPLTGLGNRRNILEYMEKRVGEYKRGSIGSLSIVLGDIDFFKKINDRYGHECGDIVLRQLAVLMERFWDGKARVGRWGGEEFLAVLPGCNGDEAAALTNEMLAEIRSMVIEYGTEKLSLTMTFGVAEYDLYAGTDATIKEADGKLYMGKEGGRNRVVF